MDPHASHPSLSAIYEGDALASGLLDLARAQREGSERLCAGISLAALSAALSAPGILGARLRLNGIDHYRYDAAFECLPVFHAEELDLLRAAERMAAQTSFPVNAIHIPPRHLAMSPHPLERETRLALDRWAALTRIEAPAFHQELVIILRDRAPELARLQRASQIGFLLPAPASPTDLALALGLTDLARALEAAEIAHATQNCAQENASPPRL